LYGVIVMVLCAFISIPFIGIRPLFCLGLLIGTAVSILNICLMTFLTETAVKNGNRFLPAIGMMLRMAIYAAAFIAALLLLGFAGGLGVAIGFITIYAAIFYVNAVQIRITKRNERREREAAEAEVVLNSKLPDNPGK